MSWSSFGGGLSKGYSSLGGYGSLFGGSNSTGSASGFDWGSALSSTFGGGGGKASSGIDWGGMVSKLFGGSNSGSSGTGSNIFGAMLGGLGGAAEAYLGKDAMSEQGKQQRRTLDFSASLEDYYKQKDKVRKRTALDTYGQFSLMDRWAPNARPPAAIDMPARPGVG